MARNFNGTDESIQTGDIDTSLISLSSWAKPDTNTRAFVLSRTYNGSNVPYLLNLKGNDGAAAQDGLASYGGWANSGMTTDIRGDGSWHQAGALYDSTTRTCVLDGADDSNSTEGQGGLPTNSVKVVDIGKYINDGDWFGGDLAEICIWSDDISLTMQGALARGVPPLVIRNDLILAYWPLWGNQDPEPDWHGQTFTGSLENTPSKTAHPPVELLENYL